MSGVSAAAMIINQVKSNVLICITGISYRLYKTDDKELLPIGNPRPEQNEGNVKMSTHRNNLEYDW